MHRPKDILVVFSYKSKVIISKDVNENAFFFSSKKMLIFTERRFSSFV